MKSAYFSRLLILILIISIFFISTASAITWTASGDAWTGTDGAYTVRMWNATGNHMWLSTGNATTVEYLVVAGGAGGSYYNGGGGGGGGAGGMLSGSGLAVSGTEIITVGVGGNGGTVGTKAGTAGGNSLLTNDGATILAHGGGTGGYYGDVGHDGGSGGGGGGHPSSLTYGNGTGSEGNRGGTGEGTTSYSGGGGGGAGHVGYNASVLGGGNGGDGAASAITGGSVDYAGGGGGSGYSTFTDGFATGTGGGGNAGDSPTAGTDGKGGGGGAGALNNGAAGGKGIVIIRYLTPVIDTTPPDSITGLTDTKNCTAIQWNWTKPQATDYSHLYTLKNNVFMANYTNESIGVVWAGLTENTAYTFSSRTVDLVGNMNATWVNRTETTDICPTPPPTPTPTPLVIPVFGDVYGFLSACNGITWILSIPVDAAYNGTMVYQNNTHLYNVTNTSASVFWVGLGEGIDYQISTKAIYLNGTVNNTWKNASSQTALCGCSFCGLTTTATVLQTIPYYPAARAGNWIRDLVMNNAWWIILLIIAYLVLRRN